MTRPSPVAVCFDLDGTLLEYEQDDETVLAETFASAGVDRFCEPRELWAAANDVPDVDGDEAFLTRMFEIAAERHGGPVAASTALASAYGEVVDHTAVTFRPGAAAALELARDHGPVGLITNGSCDVQERKLDVLGIADAFATRVYAGEQTPPKPARAAFDRALSALGTSAQETLYVGNSVKHDVGGAKGAGLQAAWFPTDHDHLAAPGEYDPDHTFDTLHDLETVL